MRYCKGCGAFNKSYKTCCKRGRVEWEQLADHWEQELAKMK